MKFAAVSDIHGNLPAPQARLAQRRGRPDWAYALATGRMPASAATIAA